MTKILSQLDAVIWGAPALVLILGVGLFLSLRLGFAQITLFPRAFRMFLEKLKPGKTEEAGVSPFQALCTALAATVGTGNLVGVAGAVCLGGPGAVFWMWVCAVLGMITKYTEAALAVRYRVNRDGSWRGGPMYMITKGMGPGFHWLAAVYSFFGIAAAFGVGNATQINAVITGMNEVLGRFGGQASQAGNLLMGLALAVLIGRLLFGGAKKIGAAAERLVPLAAAVYVLACCFVLVMRAEAIPYAFGAIIRGAFAPKAVTGGMLGSAFQALRIGCSRGVFTNEAGMGTASIAHASAQVEHPAEQGLMGIMEVFLDTIVICTMTALVILVSGVSIPYGVDVGGELTVRAFSSVYGDGAAVFLALAICCFAIATVLGWSLYGARCAQFLFGEKAWKFFALAQVIMVIISSVADGAVLWQLSQICNGLMAIPNLITLAVLAPEAARLTKEYKNRIRKGSVEVTYADFH